MITYLKNDDNGLKFIKNKNEIIIDPIEKNEASVLIKQSDEMYKLLLKYYKLILNEYYRHLETQDKETINREIKYYNMLNETLNYTEIKFYSDNSIPQLANIFSIGKTIDNISLNTYTKNDEFLGDFVLLTSEDNYGKYGPFFEIISSMIESIDENQKEEKKLVKQ